MRLIITGGTGLIGRALAADMAADGHEVIVLSRHPERVSGLPQGVQAVQWDGQSGQGWADVLDGAGAVVNLAGESVAGQGLLDMRWTAPRKRRIYQSRINAGQAVVAAFESAGNRPPVLVQSSAVGYYGPQRGDHEVKEDAPPADDFLASVCVDWEDSTAAVEALGVRRAIIRTGVVLSPEGGALPRQMLPFRLFAGGPLGNGHQWFPWIHIADEVAAIRFLIENEQASGPFNLAAPNPLTNAAFSRALGRVMGRPAMLPAPGFAFKLAFGEAATILLDGQRVVPGRLLEMGFTFQYPEAQAALENLLTS